tara:strand:+ start:12239 stop:13018 length:780 start_codon:yes stop_codon:yes gene_type:complete
MKYNTDINLLGGIQDFHMIYEALNRHFNGESDLRNVMTQQNSYGIRTESGRKRLYDSINSFVLDFKNNNHKSIYQSFFKNLDLGLPFNLLIFWQLSLNNDLFRVLTKDVYLKFYFQGKAHLTAADILFFINELKETDSDFKQLEWSQLTIKAIASKYLTILRKLGLVEGVKKKVIKHVPISDNELATFLYLFSAVYPNGENLLFHEFNVFSFVTAENQLERMKKLTRKGLIGMTYTGTKLTIEPIINYKDLSDGIYRRS